MKHSLRIAFALALVSTVTLAPVAMAKAVDSCPFKSAGQAADKSREKVQSELAALLGPKTNKDKSNSVIR